MGLRGNAIAIYMCWSSDQSSNVRTPTRSRCAACGMQRLRL